jgi:hypothetical protein
LPHYLFAPFPVCPNSRFPYLLVPPLPNSLPPILKMACR